MHEPACTRALALICRLNETDCEPSITRGETDYVQAFIPDEDHLALADTRAARADVHFSPDYFT